MVAFKSIVFGSLLAATSIATPFSGMRLEERQTQCLTSSQAQQVISNWAKLITSYSAALANATLTPNFTDYSESINTLIDSCPQGSATHPVPLTGPTFSSRAELEAQQSQQAPINYQVLQWWYTCSTVNFRWISTNTTSQAGTKPVIGISTLLVTPAPTGNQYPFMVYLAYNEFDSGAWLQNLQAAGYCPTSTSTSTTTSTHATTTSTPTKAARLRRL